MIVKVCRLRDPDNIRAPSNGCRWTSAASFSIPAPRCVPDDEFHAAAARSCRRPAVGSSSMLRPPRYTRTAERFGLERLQLHGGDESPEACGGASAAGFRIIKAIRVARRLATSRRPGPTKIAPTTCCSTPRCDGYGGSGRRFDWSVLDAYAGRVPFLLSGGIDAECAKRSGIRPFPLRGRGSQQRIRNGPGGEGRRKTRKNSFQKSNYHEQNQSVIRLRQAGYTLHLTFAPGIPIRRTPPR